MGGEVELREVRERVEEVQHVVRHVEAQLKEQKCLNAPEQCPVRVQRAQTSAAGGRARVSTWSCTLNVRMISAEVFTHPSSSIPQLSVQTLECCGQLADAARGGDLSAGCLRRAQRANSAEEVQAGRHPGAAHQAACRRVFIIPEMVKSLV